MFDKPKRKNNEIRLSYYDKNWLYAFYRWARVSQSRHIHIPFSPEICLQRLKPIDDTQNLPSDKIHIRKKEIVPLDDGSGYEFQAQIRIGWREYHQPDVNGLIVDDGYGQSLVTLRTYPPMLYVGGIILLLLCCYGSWHSLERGVVCGFALMLLVPCFGAIADQANALDYIVDQFTQPQPLPALDEDGLPLKKPRRLKNMQRKF